MRPTSLPKPPCSVLCEIGVDLGEQALDGASEGHELLFSNALLRRLHIPEHSHRRRARLTVRAFSWPREPVQHLACVFPKRFQILLGQFHLTLPRTDGPLIIV